MGAAGAAIDIQLISFTRNAQAAPLADGEVMNAGMPADHFAIGGDDFPARIGFRRALLLEIAVDEGRVVAVGDEANLLAVWLRRGRYAEFTRQFAHLRFLHAAQRKARARELLLLQAE